MDLQASKSLVQKLKSNDTRGEPRAHSLIYVPILRMSMGGARVDAAVTALLGDDNVRAITQRLSNVFRASDAISLEVASGTYITAEQQIALLSIEDGLLRPCPSGEIEGVSIGGAGATPGLVSWPIAHGVVRPPEGVARMTAGNALMQLAGLRLAAARVLE